MTEDAPGGIEKNDRGELVLDIDQLRPKPRWLRIAGREVRIPGNLPLQTMLDLQSMEARIGTPSSTDASVLDTLQEFSGILSAIIADANPDLDEDVIGELDFLTATRLLIFLAQPNDTMAAAFVDAITAGGGEKPDVANDAHRLARAAGLENPEDGEKAEAPLRSEKRSSSRSSPSGRSTTGRPSGGSDPAAPGKRSGRTSRSRSAGSANAKRR